MDACSAIIEKVATFVSVEYGIQLDRREVINLASFQTAWEFTFCIDTNTFFALNPSQSKLIKTKEKDLKDSQLDYLVCGFLNKGLIDKIMKQSSGDIDRYKIEADLNKVAKSEFINQIKFNRQFKSIKLAVDIFSESVLTKDNGHELTIYLTQPMLKTDIKNNVNTEQVVNDFKDHFPEFDSFIDMVAASRFAPDRREAFCWLHAPSSWGKGMLMSAFKNLGLVSELSIKEIEAAMEGKPVGLDSMKLAHSWILWVDEFKTVKGELKQLNNTLMLAAKYELKTEVDVYLKMFTSAELVSSLAGENGVEDQFAKRFSYLNGSGTLDSRDVLKVVGKGVYLRCLTAYIGKRLNNLIDHYRAMGIDKAEVESDKLLKRWRLDHSITDIYGYLDDSIKELANEFRGLTYHLGLDVIQGKNVSRIFPDNAARIHREIKANLSIGYYGPEREKIIHLSSPVKTIKDWLATTIDRSELITVAHKANAIIEMSSDVEDPLKNKRIYNSPIDTVGTTKKGMILFVRKSTVEITDDDEMSFM